MKPNPITGHYKTLSRDEWVEGYQSHLNLARTNLQKAKSGMFGKDYYLIKAEAALSLAEQCYRVIKSIDDDINAFFKNDINAFFKISLPDV